MGYLTPVGTPAQRVAGVYYPPGWFDATGFNKRYRIGTPKEAYHTGSDLNLNVPKFDSDAHSPVWAIAPGIVLSTSSLSGWGPTVTIWHVSPAAHPVIARYAHVEDIQVHVGEEVTAQKQIAKVGSGDGIVPFHLHFDISHTWILASQPGHWPKLNQLNLLANYKDPEAFIKMWATWDDQLMLDMWTQVRLKLRLQPNPTAGVKRLMLPNEKVKVGPPLISDKYRWRKVITSRDSGFAAETEGAEVYLAPRPIDEPPPAPGDTPYTGRVSMWHWKGSVYQTQKNFTIDEFVGSIKAAAPALNSLFIKTSDGTERQGENDTSPHLSVTGPERVDEWIAVCAKYGIACHAWAVMHGAEATLDQEAARVIEVCQRPGLASMILDVEPYAGYWQGGRTAQRPLMERIRAAVGPNFHIGMAVDPRPQHYANIGPAEWRPFLNSIHMMCYWETFGRPYDEVLNEAYQTWGNYGLPLFPIMQVRSDPATITKARLFAERQLAAKGLSWWVYHVATPETLDALAVPIGAEPPPPPPPPPPPQTDEGEQVIVIADPSVNVRPEPTTDKPKIATLPKGTRLWITGNTPGTGSKRGWGRRVGAPGYVSRDWLARPYKFGLHVHQDYDVAATRAVVSSGFCAGTTTVGDVDFANWAAQYCTSIFRMVWTDHDESPRVTRDPVKDRKLGREWFYDGIDQNRNMWWHNRQCKKNVILQITNEWNEWRDSEFEIGAMEAAEQEGYRLVICNDAVGNPADDTDNGLRGLYFDDLGNPFTSVVPGTGMTVWDHRVPALTYAALHGHYFGVHTYGHITGHFTPVSAYDDRDRPNFIDPRKSYWGALRWYGGRPFQYYKLTPFPRPKMIITEAGPGKAELQQAMGFDLMWLDVVEYEAICAELQYLLSFHWWTGGARGDMYGFKGASIDQWLWLLLEKLKQRAVVMA